MVVELIDMTTKPTIECDSCGLTMFDTPNTRDEMDVHEAECDWLDTPRERFEVGDRVQYSDFGRARLNREHREGEIAGFSADVRLVRVRWDGNKSASRYAHLFIKHVEDNHD